jgi:hypothetical protein
VDEGAFVARVAPDGRVSFDDRSSIGVRVHIPDRSDLKRWLRDPLNESESNDGLPPPLIEGRFEMTDLVMRAVGQDPYSARKMALLDRTRDERMAMALTENRARLRAALLRTPANLDRLWRAPGSSLAAKRRLLFTLWDECAEAGSDEVVATARAVRATIEAFIRRRLPSGSGDAYGTDEIAELNRRRTSRARFAPYD